MTKDIVFNKPKRIAGDINWFRAHPVMSDLYENRNAYLEASASMNRFLQTHYESIVQHIARKYMDRVMDADDVAPPTKHQVDQFVFQCAFGATT